MARIAARTVSAVVETLPPTQASASPRATSQAPKPGPPSSSARASRAPAPLPRAFQLDPGEVYAGPVGRRADGDRSAEERDDRDPVVGEAAGGLDRARVGAVGEDDTSRPELPGALAKL